MTFSNLERIMLHVDISFIRNDCDAIVSLRVPRTLHMIVNERNLSSLEEVKSSNETF